MTRERTLGAKAERGLTYEEVEELAWIIRQWLVPGCDALLRLPGLSLFEMLHEYTVPTVSDEELVVAWDVVPELQSGEAQTSYRRSQNGQPPAMLIELTEDTYLRLEAEEGRARFDLYHELAHALVHARLLRKRAFMKSTSLQRAVVDLMLITASHRMYEDVEWQADAVAGATLMPAEGIAAIIDEVPSPLRSNRYMARKVADHFRASLQAAEKRLKVFLDRRESLLGVSRTGRSS